MLDVSFVLTMQDGTERRAETSVSIEQRPLSYMGSFNIQSAAIYPGKTLTVTADVYGENEINRVQLPASWQWDGQPIPGYSNDTFTILNDRANSKYTLNIPADAKPGFHTLTFTIGSSDSTGIRQLVLSANIEIVSPNVIQEDAA